MQFTSVFKSNHNFSKWTDRPSFVHSNSTFISQKPAFSFSNFYQPIRGKKDIKKTVKIIFTKDIPKIHAIAGQEKDVARGFARNHL
jgi:hypothetical protein